MAEVSRTHMTDTATYVLYRGDEVLDVGTASEIAKRRGVRQETIRFYCTASYQRRIRNRDKRLVAERVVE